MLLQTDIPPELNFLLRKYALETGKGSREKALLYILKNFLDKYYKE